MRGQSETPNLALGMFLYCIIYPYIVVVHGLNQQSPIQTEVRTKRKKELQHENIIPGIKFLQILFKKNQFVK